MRGGATEPTKPDLDTIATPRRPTAPNGRPWRAGVLAPISILTTIAGTRNPLRPAPIPHISALPPNKAVVGSVIWSSTGLFEKLIDSVHHSLGGMHEDLESDSLRA